MFQLVQGRPDVIQPGKRPLSSMTPTIVVKDGRAVLVLGSPGGSRIPGIVLETLINVIDYGMTPQEAVDAPRIHHQWLPDSVAVEPWALSPDTAVLLTRMGYTLETERPWGAVELIETAPPVAPGGAPSASGIDAMLSGRLRPGLLYGANDSRRPAGSAVGY
jgi:gamma-glutamyltranspeptidase/glutathione hydrolase